MSAVFNVRSIARLSFSSVTSPTGFPIDGQWMETEALQSAGVDSTRWRRKRILARPWEVDAISGFTSYDLAKSEVRLYQKVSGRAGTLTLSIAATTYNWTDVHAELVSFTVSSGPIYGSSVTSNSTHQVRSRWEFTLTDLSLLYTVNA